MPFQGGIESVANATVIFSVVAALLYAFLLEQKPSLSRSAVKTISTTLLAVLAWQQGGPGLLVAALALSALGDAFLSREGDAAFLGGLASFLTAHIAFIALFHGAGEGFGLLTAEPWRAMAAIVVAAFTAGVMFILIQRVPPTLRLPVALYGATILGMGVMALTTRSPLVIVGAALFMASDTLLGWERFVMRSISASRRVVRMAVWVLYYAAQLLITLGFLLA